MRQPHHSRLSPRSKNNEFQRDLPTGSSFGGANFNIIQSEELVFSIVSDSVLIADYTTPVQIEQPSPLVIEVGKIFVSTIWFWCLIGANYCFDSISTVVRYCIPDL